MNPRKLLKKPLWFSAISASRRPALSPVRLDSVYRLDKLLVDFPAVADQSHPQHFLLSVGLVNDPVITDAQFLLHHFADDRP